MYSLQELVENGLAIRKIVFYLNQDEKEIRDNIKINGYQLKKEKYSEGQKDALRKRTIELYKLGVSAKVLGQKFNIGKLKVQKWAKEEGLLRSSSEACRIHQVNQTIFDNIDSSKKAYWLGFLYADAYNYEKKGWVVLGLQEKDLDHIHKFVEFMEGDIKSIKYVENTKSYYYKINSKYLSKVLAEKGCPQAKSFIIKYPDWLRDDLKYHFIRGYFDGDGCLTFRQKQKEYKWSIVGTLELCESIVKIFKEKEIELKSRYLSKTNNNTWFLESSGNLKIQKILDLIYQDADVYLTRKYEKYQDLIAFNNGRHPK